MCLFGTIIDDLDVFYTFIDQLFDQDSASSNFLAAEILSDLSSLLEGLDNEIVEVGQYGLHKGEVVGVDDEEVPECG